MKKVIYLEPLSGTKEMMENLREHYVWPAQQLIIRNMVYGAIISLDCIFSWFMGPSMPWWWFFAKSDPNLKIFKTTIYCGIGDRQT